MIDTVYPLLDLPTNVWIYRFSLNNNNRMKWSSTRVHRLRNSSIPDLQILTSYRVLKTTAFNSILTTFRNKYMRYMRRSFLVFRFINNFPPNPQSQHPHHEAASTNCNNHTYQRYHEKA